MISLAGGLPSPVLQPTSSLQRLSPSRQQRGFPPFHPRPRAPCVMSGRTDLIFKITFATM